LSKFVPLGKISAIFDLKFLLKFVYPCQSLSTLAKVCPPPIPIMPKSVPLAEVFPNLFAEVFPTKVIPPFGFFMIIYFLFQGKDELKSMIFSDFICLNSGVQ
jgi:hypothetical protein